MRFTAPPHGLAAIPRRRFLPLFAPLLAYRLGAVAIALAAIVHLLAVQFGLPGVGCPIHEFAGVTCPGCGLTAATLHLCHGEWQAGIARHAFAPVFMLGIVGSMAAGVLPGGWRSSALQKLADCEARSGVVAVLGIALVFYWGLRLATGN
jgi:Protein of unknown function (DUF2752)